jgi:uncharacterized protein YjbI with pentapeptide repeats
MAKLEQLELIHKGVSAWNNWRHKNPDIKPDLSFAEIHITDLKSINLTETNLRGTTFHHPDLRNAYLNDSELTWADLSYGKLMGANFMRANLRDTLFTGATLCGACLIYTRLICTDFTNADLSGCYIFGISAWEVKLDGAVQRNLDISPVGGGIPRITIDNLEIAQFIYLLLNSEKLRNAIQTITSKMVLILGRFTSEGMSVLDIIRNGLRDRNYIPVLFDFERPPTRDLTETVMTLAHLARFIVVDITDPRCVPQELQAIVPILAVPVQPLLNSSDHKYGTFGDLRKYDWFLPLQNYNDVEELLKSFNDKIIAPAEAKLAELAKRH